MTFVVLRKAVDNVSVEYVGTSAENAFNVADYIKVDGDNSSVEIWEKGLHIRTLN